MSPLEGHFPTICDFRRILLVVCMVRISWRSHRGKVVGSFQALRSARALPGGKNDAYRSQKAVKTGSYLGDVGATRRGDNQHEGHSRPARPRSGDGAHVTRQIGCLKLLKRADDESLMMFEEATPAGTGTSMHLHHDSDEVTYVLSGEFTFKIGEEITVGGPGTCAFMPRGVLHAWKNTGAEPGKALFYLYPCWSREVIRGAETGATLASVDGCG